MLAGPTCVVLPSARARLQRTFQHLVFSPNQFDPLLDIYVQVRSVRDQDELVAKGIKHAGTGYIESTLLRGSKLLKDMGMPEADVQDLVENFQRDNYTLIRSASAKLKREQ